MLFFLALLSAVGGAFGSQHVLLGLCILDPRCFFGSALCVKEGDGTCAWWNRNSMPSDWVCGVVENYTAAADRFRVCVDFAEGFRLQRTGHSSRREERAEQ